MLRRWAYFSREAWQSITRGGLMSLLAASTIALAMFILGIFLLAFFNFYNLLGALNSRLDIMAYARPAAGGNDLDLLNMTISDLNGVKKVQFIAKETAWRQFKESHANLQLDDFLEDNPLPNSFKVEVHDLSYINLVANKLRALENIEDVSYGGELAERLALLIKVLTTGGVIVILVLIASTLMIVVNTIRLTVVARENEINIMSLVGASRSFIKYPFIVEGMLIGLLGSLAAIASLKAGYGAAILQMERIMPFVPVNLKPTEINLVFLLLLAAGVFLGWLGGYVSVSRSLKAE
ncbi:MAG: permease-like cell division protein FtsX [Candidatus Margulisbacteria bacterium]|jgi:cell division transport system permease protein|nr:permease-like cell division protein FtsX [Candidatus Margulisiibacteriota bacterium]